MSETLRVSRPSGLITFWPQTIPYKNRDGGRSQQPVAQCDTSIGAGMVLRQEALLLLGYT